MFQSEVASFLEKGAITQDLVLITNYAKEGSDDSAHLYSILRAFAVRTLMDELTKTLASNPTTLA